MALFHAVGIVLGLLASNLAGEGKVVEESGPVEALRFELRRQV